MRYFAQLDHENVIVAIASSASVIEGENVIELKEYKRELLGMRYIWENNSFKEVHQPELVEEISELDHLKARLTLTESENAALKAADLENKEAIATLVEMISTKTTNVKM